MTSDELSRPSANWSYSADVSPEVAELVAALDDQRAGVLNKLAGLDDEDARRSTVESGTNLAGLLQHLTFVESLWFEQIVAGGKARRGLRSMTVDSSVSLQSGRVLRRRNMSEDRRVDFDLDRYVDRVRTGPCFVCAIVRGDHELTTHVVYRDDRHIAFLPNDHVLRGYVLVAPLEHREAVIEDFTLAEYLDLQAVVHRVGSALAAALPTERIYILSLGSQQGNAHVHWHVAALPPGVPYHEQQFRALMAETKGVLALSTDEQCELADRITHAIADSRPQGLA